MRQLCRWLPLLLASATITVSAFAQSPTPIPEPAPGFVLLDSGIGVEFYKKEYSNGNPDYVQVIDLSQGARLELLHGSITEPRSTKGDYGGADPRLMSIPLEGYWEQALAADEHAFCVTNGLFFYMPEYPTRLAFPLKVNGEIITDGWGKNTYVGEQLLLKIWEDRADIVKLSKGSLVSSSAPNIIGGLTEQANKRAKFAVGRTFIGIDDHDGDGRYETVLIFNTISAQQTSAADVLRSFGAKKVMMLDGGGSTQLICRSGWHIRSDRPIPQAIAVIAAPGPAIAGEITGLKEWTVLLEGEPLPFEAEIRNTGILSWTQKSTAFVIRMDQQKYERRFSIPATIAPGEVAALHEALPASETNSISTVDITIEIEHNGKIFSPHTLKIKTIVLPSALGSRKADLEAELQSRQTSQPDEMEQLVMEWIDSQKGKTDVQVEVSNGTLIQPQLAALIPLLMLPVLALIAWFIARTQH